MSVSSVKFPDVHWQLRRVEIEGSTLKALPFGGPHDCLKEAQVGQDRCSDAREVTAGRAAADDVDSREREHYMRELLSHWGRQVGVRTAVINEPNSVYAKRNIGFSRKVWLKAYPVSLWDMGGRCSYSYHSQRAPSSVSGKSVMLSSHFSL